MIKTILSLTFALLFSVPLHADWVNSLGKLQSSHALKQSYMQGLLSQNTYGRYDLGDLLFPEKIKHFYEQRDYQTFWFSSFNEADLSILDMLSVIKHAPTEGLDSERYHLTEIESLFDDIQNSQYYNDKDQNLATITLDILLTDAFFGLSHDLYVGLIDPHKFKAILKAKSEKKKINYTWEVSFPKIDSEALLKKVKHNGEIKHTLYSLVTTNIIYTQLLEAYKHYQQIVNDGGFTKVPNQNLKLGTRGKGVAKLAKRLYESGDLDFYDDSYLYFDGILKDALKHFQKRMGLWTTGSLNQSTLRALNVSASKRLQKIKLNLERARWEKKLMTGVHVFVNIPAFMMYFMDGEAQMLYMRVVVGRIKNPTPIFSSKMSYVVLNPTWSVPESIILKEMLHKLQDDPDYLSRRKFKAYDGWGKNRHEIDPFDIDWYQYDENSKLPFNFVRDSGKGNPLGNVKFMFPNKYAVYMHDTNDKKYFKSTVRAYSHGCIRLSKPQKMLEFIADNFMNKSYKSVKKMLKKGDKCSLNMDEKVNVYIRYYTAWVDENGVNFRSDIYGYDKIQLHLMQ